MSHNIPRTKTIYHLDDIDATKIGIHRIANTPNQKFYATECFIELLSQKGLSSLPTISVGAFSNYTNIVEATLLEGMFEKGSLHFFNLTGLRHIVLPNSTIGLRVVAPAQGSNILEYKLRCILIGALV